MYHNSQQLNLVHLHSNATIKKLSISFTADLSVRQYDWTFKEEL